MSPFFSKIDPAKPKATRVKKVAAKKRAAKKNG